MSFFEHPSTNFNGKEDEPARFEVKYKLARKRGYRTGPLQWSAFGSDTGPFLSHALKVDISALDICPDQLDAEPVANVHAFKTAHQFSLDGRSENTDPGAFVRGTGDNGIEALADP